MLSETYAPSNTATIYTNSLRCIGTGSVRLAVRSTNTVATANAMMRGIRHIRRMGVPPQIPQPIVCMPAVLMTSLQTRRAGSDKRLQHELMNVPIVPVAVLQQHYSKMPVSAWSWCKDLTTHCVVAAITALNNSRQAPNTATVRDLVVPFVSRNVFPRLTHIQLYLKPGECQVRGRHSEQKAWEPVTIKLASSAPL